eukprot:6884968-Heterocapsa_arctica.AAC.1
MPNPCRDEQNPCQIHAESMPGLKNTCQIHAESMPVSMPANSAPDCPTNSKSNDNDHEFYRCELTI